MEILKGRVQDPGFPDTEITYLKTDDGKTYFFIENGTLKNGNYIATPNLKEGIGHAPYTSLGVVTPDGNVLIPFENKNIQVLSNDLLLVERNKPITETVVNAIEKQSDPLAVSELVEAANTIKSQITSVMGSNGNFVFDNQFSEAALYTTDGVNLGNNYFSFIGAKDGAYFMSANVVGSPISKYDPYAFAMENDNSVQQQENNNQMDNTEVTTETDSVDQTISDSENAGEVEVPQVQETNDSLDNNNQEVGQPLEDTSLANLAGSEQMASVEDISNNVEQSDIPLTPDIPIASEEMNQDSTNIENANAIENTTDTNADISMPEGINIPLFSDTIASSNQEQSPNSEEELNQSAYDSGTDNSAEETSTNEFDNPPELNISIDDGISSEESIETADTVDDSQTEEDNDNNLVEEAETIEEDNDDSDDENDEVSEQDDYEDENSDSTSDGGEELEEETQEEQESDDEKYYEENFDNPIIASATDTIKKLLDENRKQRQQIDQQESELYTLKTNNEILQEDNVAKTQEINTLRRAHETDRKNNIDLLRENNKLKAANIRQDEIIDNLKQQNAALKEQVAGISALNNAVMEANTVFGNDSSDDYGYLDDIEGHQYKKSA